MYSSNLFEGLILFTRMQHALYVLSADDSGRFLQNRTEVAQIVGGQNAWSMRAKRSDPQKDYYILLIFRGEFLAFFPRRENPFVFFECFSLFSRDFRGLVGKNPCFLGGFPCLCPPPPKKARKGRTGSGKLQNDISNNFSNSPNSARIFPRL